MEKLENSNKNEQTKIVLDRLKRFNSLVKGHKKLLEAIGNL
ncbi:MAG: hypothetical protein ACMXYF_03780 [Candidatus Woesearchaeota archaeon]